MLTLEGRSLLFHSFFRTEYNQLYIEKRLLMLFYTTQCLLRKLRLSPDIWDFLYITDSYTFNNSSILTAHANI